MCRDQLFRIDASENNCADYSRWTHRIEGIELCEFCAKKARNKIACILDKPWIKANSE